MQNTSPKATDTEREILCAAVINKGIDCYQAGKSSEALQAYNRALEIDPNSALAYMNRGILYRDNRMMADMQRDLKKAAELGINNVEIQKNITESLTSSEHYMLSIEILHKALERHPECLDLWIRLTDAYYYIGNSEGAKRLLDDLSTRYPTVAGFLLWKTMFVPQIAHSNASIDQNRKEILEGMKTLLKKNITVSELNACLPNSLFYLLYQGRNHKEMAEPMAHFFSQISPDLEYTAPHCNLPKKKQGENLRIGFVTPNFHHKVINQFMMEIFNTLDKDEHIDVTVFSNAPPNHKGTITNAQQINHYVQLPTGMQEARQTIADEKMDILIYLEVGSDRLMYCLPFARLAPMQCVWGGLPVTTGIPNMDYYVTSEDVEPENAEQYYTEKLIMLSRTLAVFSRPPVYRPFKTRKQLGLPEDAHLYTCPVTLFKLHPDMDPVFARILKEDPKALILLFDPKRNLRQIALRKRFEETIPADVRDRIVFMPFLEPENFLHMITAVDCIMDSFHYSFGTTAYLCFAMNVPFVTWEGPYLSGRAGMRMYNHLDMPEMIAKTHDEFAEKALRLAADKDWYKEQQKKIEERADIFFNDYAIVDEFKEKLLSAYYDG